MPSHGNQYIIITADYVSKLIEGVATSKIDTQIMIKSLKKNIFFRFEVPRVLITNGGSHFCNKRIETFLRKYGIYHRIATTYHPQIKGQAKISNREIKQILEKWSVLI